MNLLGPALSMYLRRVDGWLRRAAANPLACQQRVFEQLLAAGRKTQFGRAHGFDRVRTHADFTRAVPVADYLAQLSWVEKMLAGEADVSWPGRTRYFAQTSGTTAGDKRIPLTDAMQASNRRAALAIFAYYKRRSPQRLRAMIGGQLLFLGGSTAMTPTGHGGWIGDLSGIASRDIGWPLEAHYEPGHELALIDNWEEKIRRVAERTVGRDVRFVTGMPSWMMVLFDHLCRLRGLDPAGGISEVWPNLHLFVHGGVNFAPYRPAFSRYFREAHPLDYLEVYPASEGFVAIQAEADSPGMEMLADNGLFFEFVPLEEFGKPDARRLTIGEVEPDVPYSLVLSTNAGLWAYDIGDVVRFLSTSPPRIVFAGRNRHFINAFGENIIGEQVSAAVAEATRQTGADVAEFTAGPRYAASEQRGCHEYVVEFDGPAPPGDVLDRFAQAIDAKLIELNHDYEVKRRGDLGMKAVEVSAVPPGTFYEWMKARGKLGGQHKVPVCANDRTYLDELLDRD